MLWMQLPFYNVSAVLEGESGPAEVIQEAVTMLSTATPSTGEIHWSTFTMQFAVQKM